MKKAALVVGARPQFIKTAPLLLEMGRFFETVLIHTGQHYDFMMSGNFFDELELPRPDYHLDLESRTPGRLTGEMIAALESIYGFEKPDFVVVIGDTNSTLAGAVSAAHLRLPIVHVEAGLRSVDKKLPEQINRVVTDSIADCFLCPTPSAVENLKNEGKRENINDTGDIIYDCLRMIENKIPERPAINIDLPGRYALMTLHRAEAVDNEDNLKKILRSLASSNIPVVFPAHPRTIKMITRFGLREAVPSNVVQTGPVGYADLLSLIKNSEYIITDSGGVQREAVFLGKRVYIPRPETEWVDFVDLGCLNVAGYSFDLGEIKIDPTLSGGELDHLLRPAAREMVEALKIAF